MILLKIFTIVLMLIDLGVICQENEDEFVATNEWQVVKKGQKIPKGLHVRINLAAGITEAKLLDENETEENSNKNLIKIDDDNVENSLSREELESVLKNIKSDDPTTKFIINKEKFRSYDELKEELKTLNLNTKLDAEVLQDLFLEFSQETDKNGEVNEESMLRILEDFDFLAHQIDNGLEFVKNDGFKRVIYKNLNATNERIKEESLKLFGSLVQNNAKVQIHALETGAVTTLLRILSNKKSSQNLISRALFALGCFLRRFPLAQREFIKNGGVQIIINAFETNSLKVQTKLATLVQDLITEKKLALEDDQYVHKQMLIDQYGQVNFYELFMENGLCDRLNKLLKSVIAADQDDHDLIERCAMAMEVVKESCKFDLEVLWKMRDKYKVLYAEHGSNDFYLNLYQIFQNIVDSFNGNVKTEL